MQPGLSRAIPMAIIGFLFGALLVIVIRGLQGLDPIWAPGPGIILSAILMAAFFVWGIGAFDPRLSVHGDESVEEAVHEELAAQSEKPRSILASYTWQITTALLVFLIIIAGFALIPGGLALTQTVVPGASPATVGYAEVPLPFGGPTVQVSTLVIFAVFIIWALVSLVAAAAVIAFLMSFLARGITEVRTVGGGAAALLPPAAQPPAERDLRATVRTVATFVITFLVLYLVFYYVAIGLIFPQPNLPVLSSFFTSSTQLAILSAVNAFVFMFVILRTQLVLNVIGIVARWLARLLRRVPHFLE